MKYKRELADFLSNIIDEEWHLEEGCHDRILIALVEFEEMKEDKSSKESK